MTQWHDPRVQAHVTRIIAQRVSGQTHHSTLIDTKIDTKTPQTPTRRLDVLFVAARSSVDAYQNLADTFAAIEPPTWALLLAQSCRTRGFGAAILDCEAERLSLAASVSRIADARARLVVFVVYGQNPNAGTTAMSGATALADRLKREHPQTVVCFVGSHTSALPREVLALPFVDIVLLNEGVYALHDLLASNLGSELPAVTGIGYKRTDGGGPPVLLLNAPQRVVPQARMDIDLPGYAWDLLPFRSRPLDLYRAHFWHADFDHDKRTPFAALYTALGCPYDCAFCMINIVNRVDNGEGVDASHSRGMRSWSTEMVLGELEHLARMGVETVRLSDEMFFLDRRRYEPLLHAIVQRGLTFRLWAYSRVDTVRPEALDLFRRAGVSWLALGIEAGNADVRTGVSNGKTGTTPIAETCAAVRRAGLSVIGNYIFGLPRDTFETMQETLDLALELNTEMANMYPCQALPGSPVHQAARRRGWTPPATYAGYGFLSYDCEPLPTEHLSAADVLRFRDAAWRTYFTNPAYLGLVEAKFGVGPRENVEHMAAIRLRRRLLGD